MKSYLTVSEGAKLLREGELVAFPTETVYGLGADALNPAAVVRIFEVKKRPAFNPLICHLPDEEAVFRYGRSSETARNLTRFWPGPLTLLLPHEGRIPSIVTAGSDLCGFRVPNHPLALELLRLVDRPLAAPSANISGKRSPTNAAMTAKQLDALIAGIIDGGSCGLGLESTVVLPRENNRVMILRSGGITEENLREAGFIVEYPPASSQTGENKEALLSPGNLLAHYAPNTPLVLLDANTNNIQLEPELLLSHELAAKGRGITLLFGNDRPYFRDMETLNLSPMGDLSEAARNLFAFFDRLDASGYDFILAHRLPESGLGRAINDRLRRAASYEGRVVKSDFFLVELGK